MSENLKRAESLFNRIMNQGSAGNNKPDNSTTSTSSKSGLNSYANAAASASSHHPRHNHHHSTSNTTSNANTSTIPHRTSNGSGTTSASHRSYADGGVPSSSPSVLPHGKSSYAKSRSTSGGGGSSNVFSESGNGTHHGASPSIPASGSFGSDSNGGRHHNNHHRHHSGHSNNGNHSHHNHSHHHTNNNTNHTNNGNAPSLSALDLPKRDPIKSSRDTLSKIPQHHHVLPYCWTIWYHSRSKAKQQHDQQITNDEVADPASGTTSAAAAVDSYLQTTNEIEFSSISGSSEKTTSIGSLEQLWLSLSSIKKSYELPIGTELLFFKSGINPVWEDPINAKGGRWVFRFSRRTNTHHHHHHNHHHEKETTAETVAKVRHRTSLIWERLLIKTLTGSIIPQSNYSDEIQDLLLNDISGLVLSVRKDEDIISIWNSNLNFNKKKQQQQQSEDGSTEKTNKKILTSFQARRIICDSILRIIRECDLINQGSDCIETLDSGSNERVSGVSFEYRLHADNNNPTLHHSNSTNNNNNSNNATAGTDKDSFAVTAANAAVNNSSPSALNGSRYNGLKRDTTNW